MNTDERKKRLKALYAEAGALETEESKYRQTVSLLRQLLSTDLVEEVPGEPENYRLTARAKEVLVEMQRNADVKYAE